MKTDKHTVILEITIYQGILLASILDFNLLMLRNILNNENKDENEINVLKNKICSYEELLEKIETAIELL